MLKHSHRTQRLSKELKKKISIILQREFKDTIINTITIIKVIVSSDLTNAKIFVSFLDINNNKKILNKIKILQNASGFISSLLCKSMYIRFLPKLIFLYDNSLSKGIHISKLINKYK